MKSCLRLFSLLWILLLVACTGDAPTSATASSAASAPATPAAPTAAATPPANFQEGQAYFPLKAPVATQAGAGQVEVLEVFSYACKHCGELAPVLADWEQRRPPAAQLRYLPAPWSNPGWMEYAAAFFAAEKLGVLARSHPALMDRLWKQKMPMVSTQEIADFHAQYGVDATAFLAEMNTSETQLKLLDTAELLNRMEVTATPVFIVDGRWRFDVGSAGGPERVGPLIDFLVAKALEAR